MRQRHQYKNSPVDAVSFEPAAAQQDPIEDREQERLATRLHATFEADSLENGIDHPAEQIIERALRTTEGQRVLEWLRALSLDAEHPSFAASVLRCMGRQIHAGTALWRARLVRDGLALDDVEIRDAAVQAAESWADPEILEVLKSHDEPQPWLRDYILGVIDDLGE